MYTRGLMKRTILDKLITFKLVDEKKRKRKYQPSANAGYTSIASSYINEGSSPLKICKFTLQTHQIKPEGAAHLFSYAYY